MPTGRSCRGRGCVRTLHSRFVCGCCGCSSSLYLFFGLLFGGCLLCLPLLWLARLRVVLLGCGVAPAWSGGWARAGWPRLCRGRAARALLRRFCVWRQPLLGWSAAEATAGAMLLCRSVSGHGSVVVRLLAVSPVVGARCAWPTRHERWPRAAVVSDASSCAIFLLVWCSFTDAFAYFLAVSSPLSIFGFVGVCGDASDGCANAPPVCPTVCLRVSCVWLICVEHCLGDCPALRLMPVTPLRATVPRARPAPPSTPGTAPRRSLGTRASARAGRPAGCATRGRTRRRPRRAAMRRRCRKTRRTKPRKGRTTRTMGACC